MFTENVMPTNWKLLPMTEVVKWGSGGTPKATERDYYENGDIPWLIIGDLNDGIVTKSQTKITQLGLENSSAKIIPAGTLMVAMYGSIGKLGITGFECCTNQAIAFAQKLTSVSLKYMFYYMSFIKPKLISMGKGGTQKNISQTVLNSLKVPVPPLDEQARIVTRIEELFSKLNNGVQTLQTIKAQLAVYRQAVLVSTLNDTGFPKMTINDVCEAIVDCPHSTPKWVEMGQLCLRTTNFKRGFLDLSVPNYVTKETFDSRNARLVPKAGDILYSREGSILGIACIIPDGINACLGQRMMLLRTSSKMNSKLLMYYLNSPMVTNHVITSKGGTGSPHINVGDIKAFRIPVPDINKQNKIVCEIEERFSVCDSIEKTVDTALSQAGAMRQSILKRAFEGGLVS